MPFVERYGMGVIASQKSSFFQQLLFGVLYIIRVEVPLRLGWAVQPYCDAKKVTCFCVFSRKKMQSHRETYKVIIAPQKSYVSVMTFVERCLVFSRREIVAKLMQNCIREYSGFSLETIMRDYLDGNDSPPGGLLGNTSVEIPSMRNGSIFCDVLVNARHPLYPGKKVGIIINIEVQNIMNPGYNLVKRAVYCREEGREEGQTGLIAAMLKADMPAGQILSLLTQDSKLTREQAQKLIEKTAAMIAVTA